MLSKPEVSPLKGMGSTITVLLSQVNVARLSLLENLSSQRNGKDIFTSPSVFSPLCQLSSWFNTIHVHCTIGSWNVRDPILIVIIIMKRNYSFYLPSAVLIALMLVELSK